MYIYICKSYQYRFTIEAAFPVKTTKNIYFCINYSFSSVMYQSIKFKNL
jgi:hypothetical protein